LFRALRPNKGAVDDGAADLPEDSTNAGQQPVIAPALTAADLSAGLSNTPLKYPARMPTNNAMQGVQSGLMTVPPIAPKKATAPTIKADFFISSSFS
jgi:hypothetical protein